MARRTFSSLSVRNYRLYFFGQVVSMSGTWIQSVAQMWLVYELTGSGVALGVVTALQFTPVLVAGMWGGIVADRFDKRKILIGTQAAAALLAALLGMLTAVRDDRALDDLRPRFRSRNRQRHRGPHPAKLRGRDGRRGSALAMRLGSTARSSRPPE